MPDYQVHVMGERSYHSHITDSTEHSTVTGLVGCTDTVEGVWYITVTHGAPTLKAKQSGQTAGYVVFIQHAIYVYILYKLKVHSHPHPT